MIYILLVLLFLLIIIGFKIVNKDLLSPFIVATAMFFLSSFVTMIYRKEWCVEINYLTIIIIIMGLVSLGIGEIFARILPIKTKKKSIEKVKDININKSVLYAIILFMAIAIIVYSIETYKLSNMYVGYKERNSILEKARAVKNSGVSIGIIAGHLYIISGVLARALTFVLLYKNVTKYKVKNKILLLIPIIMYGFLTILTTGRTEMLNFIISIVITYVLISRLYTSRKINNVKFLKITIMSSLGFFILFSILGNIGNRIQGDNLIENASIYIGSSIAGLNTYLGEPKFSNEYFGSHTFFGIFSFLRTLGLDIPNFKAPLEYIYQGDLVTNVYTAFRRYYQDFGMLGLVVIQFLTGFIYTRVLLSIYRRPKIIKILLLSYFYYPIIQMSIEERIFMEVLSAGSIYTICYFVVINKILFKNNKELIGYE